MMRIERDICAHEYRHFKDLGGGHTKCIRCGVRPFWDDLTADLNDPEFRREYEAANARIAAMIARSAPKPPPDTSWIVMECVCCRRTDGKHDSWWRRTLDSLKAPK